MRCVQPCRSQRAAGQAVWLGAVLACCPCLLRASDAPAPLAVFHSNRYGFKLSVPADWRVQPPPPDGAVVIVAREPAAQVAPVTLTVRVSPSPSPVRPDQRAQVLANLLREVGQQVKTQLPGFRTESLKPVQLAAGVPCARLDVAGRSKQRDVRQVRVMAVGTHYAYFFDWTIPADRYDKVRPLVGQVIHSIWIPPAPVEPPAAAASLLAKRDGTRVRLYERQRFGIRIPSTWRRVENKRPGVSDVFVVDRGPGMRELTLTVTCRDWLRRVDPRDLPGYLKTTTAEFQDQLPGCRVLSTSLVDIGQGEQAARIECALELNGVAMRMLQTSAFRGNTMYSLVFVVPKAHYPTYAHAIREACESLRAW